MIEEEKLTFFELCEECLKNDALVREWNRLFGYKLGVERSPAVMAVDQACGYDPDKEAMPHFVDFVYEYIWLPVAQKSKGLKMTGALNGN
jgi:hypothetical protein